MRIGRIIPWLIALGIVLDAGTRLIPIDMFAFRAWEVLSAGRSNTGPFAPNATYVNPMSYGDLAIAPRRAHLRNHHLEVFTTDAWGFRNPPDAFAAPSDGTDWLMIGDSFGVSSGVTDEQSLARQLEDRLDVRVYNASTDRGILLSDIDGTMSRLGMRGGVVLYELMERAPTHAVQDLAAPRVYSSGPPASPRSFRARFDRFRQAADVSRLRILAGWAWRGLTGHAQDVAGPVFAVSEHRLTNGDRMLFLDDDIAFSHAADRRFDPNYMIVLREELARRGLTLVVLLLPNKYTVYGPLIADPGVPTAHAEPIAALETALRNAGVLVVNPTDRMRAAASDALSRHELLYFPDDTHWNQNGIAVAADAVAEAFRARPAR